MPQGTGKDLQDAKPYTAETSTEPARAPLLRPPLLRPPLQTKQPLVPLQECSSASSPRAEPAPLAMPSVPGTAAPSSRAPTPQTAPHLHPDAVSPMDEDTEVVPVTSPQRNPTHTDSQQTPLITSQQVMPPEQRWNRQHIHTQDQVAPQRTL